MSWVDWLFWAQAVSTGVMVGIIWFVQIVHYPLFALVGRDGFPAYEREHQRRTGWVVLPPMVLELAASLGLLFSRPESLSPVLTWANVGTVLAIWLLTFLWQVPLHERLAKEFDERTHHWLVRGNWSRTLLWSLRGGLVIGLAQGLMRFDGHVG